MSLTNIQPKGNWLLFVLLICLSSPFWQNLMQTWNLTHNEPPVTTSSRLGPVFDILVWLSICIAIAAWFLWLRWRSPKVRIPIFPRPAKPLAGFIASAVFVVLVVGYFCFGIIECSRILFSQPGRIVDMMLGLLWSYLVIVMRAMSIEIERARQK